MFRDCQKVVEEAKKLPTDACVKALGELLRDLGEWLSHLELKPRPALFYDPVTHKMVNSVTVEHMQLAGLRTTLGRL